MYGKDVKNKCKPLTKDNIDCVKNFNCGNEVVNLYLREEALNDTKAKTFMKMDIQWNKLNMPQVNLT